MREVFIATCRANTERGAALHLDYSILVEETAEDLEYYGTQITERESGASVRCPRITMSAQRIHEFIELLIRGTVTPTGMMDVVSDWL